MSIQLSDITTVIIVLGLVWAVCVNHDKDLMEIFKVVASFIIGAVYQKKQDKKRNNNDS